MFLSDHDISADKLINMLEDVIIPMQSIITVLTIAVIYTLLINNRLMVKVTAQQGKNNPFSSTGLLALLLAFIDLQKIIFKLLSLWLLKYYKDNQTDMTPAQVMYEIVRMRYAVMAVEFLFIIIPMRHNFQAHRLEI